MQFRAVARELGSSQAPRWHPLSAGFASRAEQLTTETAGFAAVSMRREAPDCGRVVRRHHPRSGRQQRRPHEMVSMSK